MSLTPAEVQAFTAALADAFPTRNDLELLLIFTGKKIEDYVTPNMAGLLPYAAVVVAASREGWVSALLQRARQMKPNNQLLGAFETQYQSTGFPVPPNPYHAPVLRANRPFIDREDLRKRMLELGSSGASRVLVVRGERYSGKSYSRFLVDHLAGNPGGFRPVVVNLVEDDITKPDELAHTLVLKMGGDVTKLPAQGVTTAARWGLFLANTIQGEVRRLGSHIWLVFDGLTRKGVLAETIELVLDLAKRAELEVPELRVVLLDLPGKLPPQVDTVALREEITIIDEAKCVEWLETVLGLLKVPTVKTELQREVSAVFAALPPAGDEKRLEALAREIWKIVVKKPTPPPAASPAGGS